MGARDRIGRRRAAFAEDLAELYRAQSLSRLLPSPTAVNQQTWFIDALNGNDLNLGTSPSAPLRTWARYIQLTGYEENFDNRSVDVFCSGTFPDSDPIIKRARSTNFNAHFGIHGVLTALLSTTLATFTAGVPATNTRCSFSVGAGLTSAMIGCLVFFPTQNAFSQITSVSGQTATCLDPTSAPTTISGFPIVRFAPNPGDPIIISRGTSIRTMLIEWLESSVSSLGFSGSPGGAFVLENFSLRSMATLVKHCGNDNVVDPVVQFNQFQDLDLVADGALYLQHNSIQFTNETTLRNRFDSTQGGYVVTGNAIMSNPAGSFPNCQLEGFEAGTFGNTGDNVVNEIFCTKGNVNIEAFAALGGRLGIWQSGTGQINFLDLHELELGTGNYFGTSSASAAFNFGRNCAVSYQTNGSAHFFATGAVTQLSFNRGAGANATPALSNVQAACTSFADVAAAPFNGKAYDTTCGARIIPF